jgi:thiol-disulfide isomerase/thioredoxin
MGEKIHIVEFYGATCPFCKMMEPKLERLEAEGDVAIERLEVWSNEENKGKMEALKHHYDKECGGNMVVPSFYDERTDRLICNPGSYEKLKEWVFQGK